MNIAGDAFLGLYMNALSLMLIMALVSLSQHLVRQRTDEDRMFLMLCVAGAVNSVCGIGFFLSKGSGSAFSRPAMTAFVTLGRMAVLALLFGYGGGCGDGIRY